MNTQINFPETETEVENSDSPKSGELPEMPEYRYRVMFRDVLQSILNDTYSNREFGSYIKAEETAKQYFLINFNIPVNAWAYRNEREYLRRK